jgi:hypothetical protein
MAAEVVKFLAKSSICVGLLIGIHDPFAPKQAAPVVTPTSSATTAAHTQHVAPGSTVAAVAQGSYKKPDWKTGQAYKPAAAAKPELEDAEDEFDEEE